MLRIPGYVSAAEASEKLGGISTQTLTKWAKKGLITAKQLPGGQLVYEEASLDVTKLCTPVTVTPAVEKTDGRKNNKGRGR